jgi:nucleotide-binding universal stress UspA family protein
VRSLASIIVVCVDGSPSDHPVLRWAAAEARRRKASLQVVVTDAQQSSRAQYSTFVDVLAAVRDVVPDVPVLGHSSHGPVADTLRELSVDAAAMVVPASFPDLAGVVADSYCPVFTVPDDFSPQEHGPVALGVAPWTGEEVIDLAFTEAALLHAPLFAVRTWSDPRLSLATLRSDRLVRWDRANERARRELELALSAWAVIHPEVQVETAVMQDNTADFLLSLTRRSRLLVLGRSTRGALLAGIAGSPVDGLLRSARCPVLVVPAEGPPRTTWLPGRTHGWSFTRR